MCFARRLSNLLTSESFSKSHPTGTIPCPSHRINVGVGAKNDQILPDQNKTLDHSPASAEVQAAAIGRSAEAEGRDPKLQLGLGWGWQTGGGRQGCWG